MSITILKDSEGQPRIKVPGHLEIGMSIPDVISMAHFILRTWGTTTTQTEEKEHGQEDRDRK